MLLPGLRIHIPDRTKWNGGVQRGILLFMDGSKLGGGKGVARS